MATLYKVRRARGRASAAARPTLNPSPAHGPWRALRHPSFRLWCAAHALSNVGTWMQLVAQNLLVLALTHSPALTGLSASAQAAPGLLLGLAGGALVDRLPLKLIATITQAGLGCLAVLTAVLAAEHALTVPLLLALGLATGVVATVDGPAVSLLGNSLVDADDVPSAIAVGSVVTSAGRILGTAIAGIAIAMLGVPAAYFLNGLTFVAVALVIPFVRSRPEHCTALPSASRPPKAESRGGIRAGLNYLLADRQLLALLGICALTSTLGRNYGLTLAPLVTGPLHGGAKGYATISAVLAVGATLGALLSGRLQRPSVATVALLGGIGASLQMVSGLAPTMGLLFAVIVPMALAESIQDTAAGTLLQTTPPAPLRARVLGAWSTASTGWNLAGPPLLGFLLQLTGPRVGLVATGAVTLAVLIGMYAQEARARWATAVAPRWLPEVS